MSAPTNSRKTPETDAVWRYPVHFAQESAVVPADFCRTMEQQRDEAREILLSIKQSVDNGDVTAMTAKGERALALLTPKPTP